VSLSKLIAPILPFSAEELYQSLVPPIDPEAPESVHLCSYPTADEDLINQDLIDDMDALKQVIELGRAARNEAKMKVRQPALRLQVKPTNSRQGETVTRLRSQILEELNVKELTVIEDETVFQTYAVKPDFSKWGPRFGKQLNVVRKALEALDPNETGMMTADGRSIELVVDGETISITPDELVLERVDADGLAVVSDFGCTVAIDTEITRELLLEGLMRDVVRHVQNLRKEADFHVNDRINLYYDTAGDLAEAISVHSEYIQAETLAVSIQAGAAPDEAVVKELKIGENALRLGVLQVAS
jgi:isoleucyl-tRNA synthetase